MNIFKKSGLIISYKEFLRRKVAKNTYYSDESIADEIINFDKKLNPTTKKDNRIIKPKSKNQRLAYYIAYSILRFQFVLIFWIWVLLLIILFYPSSGGGSRKSYRHSNRYRKVIKEGIFFDSVEYHER